MTSAGKTIKKVFVAFVPENLSPEDISILTVRRQKVLISLLKEKKTLSRLAKECKLAVSSISESMDTLKELHIVEKDENKVWRLTRKGKLLALTLLIPNGFGFSARDSLLDKVLKEEFGIDDQGYRDEVIENCILLEKTFEKTLK